MKLKIVVLLLFAGAIMLTGRFISSAAGQPQVEPPLRLAEPADRIVADLEQFIPAYMAQEQIPAAGIALIKEGKLVWRGGFGLANTVTRRPVTPETVFELASNSKLLTAYIALRLVERGQLALDEPLNGYLPEPWLPPSPYRDRITLRHVLSHSSGLGHGTASRESLFPPGTGYAYSAVGYRYLQVVIEQVTGQPLETVAPELLFEPLAMSSTSLVNRPDLTPRSANGHLHALVPALLWTVFFGVSLLVIGLAGLLILRWRTGRWRPGQRPALGMLAGALGASLLLPFFLLGPTVLFEFAWLVAGVGLGLVALVALAVWAGWIAIRRLIPRRPRPRLALTLAWSGLVLAGLILVASQITNLPVPRWPAVEAEAAGSARATAGDLALFLLELAEPQHLSAELATELRTPQVQLSDRLAWGLGPGLLHSEQGQALWQWGQHVDFQSIAIIYPDLGFGVVVCTNNDLLNPDVALEIAHRALGGPIEPLRRAIHLEYNYREGDE